MVLFKFIESKRLLDDSLIERTTPSDEDLFEIPKKNYFWRSLFKLPLEKLAVPYCFFHKVEECNQKTKFKTRILSQR